MSNFHRHPRESYPRRVARSDYSDHGSSQQRGSNNGPYDYDGLHDNGYDRPAYSDHPRPRKRDSHDGAQDAFKRPEQSRYDPRGQDEDVDSAYDSNHSSSGPSHQEAKAQSIHDLNAKLSKADEEIKDYQEAEANWQNKEGELERQLENLRQLRREDAGEIDRLRMALGKQYVDAKLGSIALKELKPLIDDHSSLLQSREEDDRSRRQDIDDARHNLHKAQFIYAKALSQTGQVQPAIDLLDAIFTERHTSDLDMLKTTTRDVQQELCTLLVGSGRQEDLKHAFKIVNRVLCNADHYYASADLPWIIENRLIKVRLLANDGKYSMAVEEAQKVWNREPNFSDKSRQSIEKGMIDLVRQLQEANKDKLAAQLIVMTLKPENTVSDASIASLAGLDTKDLLRAWAKCSTLHAAERCRVGWELVRLLNKDGRQSDAAELVKHLPNPPAPSAPSGTTCRDCINDGRSQELVKLKDFSKLRTAADLAAALFKNYGFSPLPGSKACHHVETLLTAVEKMAASASGRSDPAMAFEEIATKWWDPVYQEVEEGRSSVDRETLKLVAKSGRELRDSWKEDAQGKRAKKNKPGKPEREARQALQEKVTRVEKWAGVGQK